MAEQVPLTVRGRGTPLNPPNRFETLAVVDDHEHFEHEAHPEADRARQIRTTVLKDSARTIINRVESDDIGFAWTINPYRGCSHGCIYCYARPSHEYLGFSSGLEFESTILAKPEAPALLRKELGKPRWRGEPIVMSGITDPYQPAERELRITRGCLEVMAECRQPVSIITKNRLVLRDLDLLRELAAHRAAQVAVSLTTVDRELARKMEPRASSPADRLRTIQALAEAGVPVHVMVAPVIPAINDRGMAETLRAASEAGAQSAGYVLLRLPYQIKTLFLDWLERHFPERAGHVESLLRQMRGGALYDARWGVRGRGEGPMAEQIGAMFRTFAKRYGLAGRGHEGGLSSAAFRRPEQGGQMSLFG